MDTERRSGWLYSGLVIIGLLMLGGLLAVLSDVTINLNGDTAPEANPSALRGSATRGEHGTGHSDTAPGASPSALDPAPTRTRQYDFGSLESPMPPAPPQRMVMTGNMLYFMTWTPGSGDELWKSDGSAGGTVRVKALNPGAKSIFPTSLTSTNGKIFFTTCDDFTSGSQRHGLWVSDGSEGGTVRLKDFTTGPDRLSPTSLISVGGDLFFSAYDRAGGTELWTSDGTESGTVRVRDINPGTESAQPAQLTDVNGQLFFTAYDGASGTELWTSDGTEGGTVLVKDISPIWSRAQPTQLTNVNGRLFFFADDGVNGIEQWTSDGSERGTIRLKDITPREAGADYALLHG
ncbi:MAG: hypothetical protein HGA19_10900 [Oscillochloris sp.]|nr:hypothetical protein [Oscillochloris sp.]